MHPLLQWQLAAQRRDGLACRGATPQACPVDGRSAAQGAGVLCASCCGFRIMVHKERAPLREASAASTPQRAGGYPPDLIRGPAGFRIAGSLRSPMPGHSAGHGGGPMIEVHALTKRYGKTRAVDDLTFEVR